MEMGDRPVSSVPLKHSVLLSPNLANLDFEKRIPKSLPLLILNMISNSTFTIVHPCALSHLDVSLEEDGEHEFLHL
jgi:hypothetical protein